MDSKGDKNVLVVAIDIGMLYNRFAFSFRSQYEQNPLDISVHSLSTSLIPWRIKTATLIDPKGAFECFGEDYQSSDLENYEGPFDQNFLGIVKMPIAENETALNSQDDNAKQIEDKKCFAHVIGYLKRCVEAFLGRENPRLRSTDIYWVLTASATEERRGREFMKEAAVLAGIDSNQIRIAFEHEAALQFCLQVSLDKPILDTGGEESRKYLIMNVGENSVELTLVQKENEVKILSKDSQKKISEILISKYFDNVWMKIVGSPTMDEFKRRFSSDYKKMHRQFHSIGRLLEHGTTGDYIFNIPNTFIQMVEDKLKTDIATTMQNSPLAEEVKFVDGRCFMAADIVKQPFHDIAENIKELFLSWRRQSKYRKLDSVFMVGTLSESRILQHTLLSELEMCGIHLIVPPNPTLAILNGSVILGHCSYSKTHQRDSGCFPSAMQQRFIAMTNYKPQKRNELELNKGALYLVFEIHNDGWYRGKCLRSGNIGIFSQHYVQNTSVSAISSHRPQSAGELQLEEGDAYVVLQLLQSGWYRGQCLKTGKIGIFPQESVQGQPTGEHVDAQVALAHGYGDDQEPWDTICCMISGHGLAKWKCINCNDYMCSSCTETHKKGKKTRRHRILHIDEWKEEENIRNKIFCKLHKGNELNMFCRTDMQIICTSCAISQKHTDHEIEPIEKHADDVRFEVGKALKDVDNMFPLYQERIDNLKRKLLEATDIKNINNASIDSVVKSHIARGGLHKQIEQKGKDLKAEEDKKMQTFEDFVKQRVKKLTGMKTETSCIILDVRLFLESCTDIELIEKADNHKISLAKITPPQQETDSPPSIECLSENDIYWKLYN